MTRHLRDTEDGINEAGWEQEMSKLDYCERCRKQTHLVVEHHIDNGENGSEWLCQFCFDRVTGTGMYDPDNRDWDAERELREFEGDL